MEHYVDINRVHLHFEESGKEDAPPVIILHGWGCNLSTVASIASAAGAGHRVFSIDLPGHGKSSEPPLLEDGKPWGVYEYADLIKTFIEQNRLHNPILIGHSYGGRIAIILGSEMPLEKIVLIDSAGIKPRRKLSYYVKIWSFKAYRKILPFIVGSRKASKLIEKRRAKAGSADYRAASPMMRMVMSRSVNQDLFHLLKLIKAPTLLIWGENDTATPLADAKIMENQIPDAGLVVFKGAGHYSFLDKPGQFKSVLNAFLTPNRTN